MTNDNETNTALFKVLIAWVGTMAGGVTLSGMVLGATLIYTLLLPHGAGASEAVRFPAPIINPNGVHRG